MAAGIQSVSRLRLVGHGIAWGTDPVSSNWRVPVGLASSSRYLRGSRRKVAMLISRAFRLRVSVLLNTLVQGDFCATVTKWENCKVRQ